MANCFNAKLATIGKTPIAQVKRLALNVIQQAEREGSGMLGWKSWLSPVPAHPHPGLRA